RIPRASGAMKYVLVFGFLGAYLAVTAATLGGVGRLLLWPAVNASVLAAAYAGLGPGVCGKRADGRLAWWAVGVLFPYLALTWLVWHSRGWPAGGAGCSGVAPGLGMGGGVLPPELPGATALVGALTADLPEPRGVVRGRSYLCLPVLDTLAPPLTAI